MKPVPVVTPEQAQILREIRNELRQYMTRDTAFITSEQQFDWFRRYIMSDGAAYLYYNDFGSVVGYGYVRMIEDKAWGSLAVKPEFQNKGYGTQIYKHMIQVAGELWIEIDSTNAESLAAAVNGGFHLEYTGDNVVVLKGSV